MTPRERKASTRGRKRAISPPTFIPPQLASPASSAPTGSQWAHEIKFDGYRIEVRIDGGEVQLLTRKGLDWTHRFGTLADELKSIAAQSAVIDGEAVVQNANGVTSFAALVGALKSKRPRDLRFMAFDLMFLDGDDLCALPLRERKERLRYLLDCSHTGTAISFSDHIAGDGKPALQEACRLGLEGIVSKRLDTPYRSGRSDDWRKVKCIEIDSFLILGFTRAKDSRDEIGALVLGAYFGGKLRYVGRVGTGFSRSAAHALHAALTSLRRPQSPLSSRLTAARRRGVFWVEPVLIAEIGYRATTTDGLLRHASFRALRDDIDPSDVVLPKRFTRAVENP